MHKLAHIKAAMLAARSDDTIVELGATVPWDTAVENVQMSTAASSLTGQRDGSHHLRLRMKGAPEELAGFIARLQAMNGEQGATYDAPPARHAARAVSVARPLR